MRTLFPKSTVDLYPYRGIILLLSATTLIGAAAAVYWGGALRQASLLGAALILGVSFISLVGVDVAANRRSRAPRLSPGYAEDEVPNQDTNRASADAPSASDPQAIPGPMSKATAPSEATAPGARGTRWVETIGRWIRRVGPVQIIRLIEGIVGLTGAVVLAFNPYRGDLPPAAAGLVGALCVAAAALAALAARYFAAISEPPLPEAQGLARAARLVTWGLGLAAFETIMASFGWLTAASLAQFAILGLVASVSWPRLRTVADAKGADTVFLLDSAVLSALGSRANPIASILDAADHQLGIDLRSTWALSVLRRSIEPLLGGRLVVGWLSTSLTVVHLGEEGLIERLGVPSVGPPLEPGLHCHWPWPVDRVFRLPVRKVQALSVGHEGTEEPGPENVLWARQHAKNEYTLLLGNGRDLITIDATVQFRVRDPRAWRYRFRNPVDALRAVAYRAVMRATVNRTLDEALSENVSLLTGRMLATVQRDVDDLGLGVDVLAFTVGGMHPPVMVAADYQAVSSAELGRVTAEVNAEAYRNRAVPEADAEIVTRLNGARADAALTEARATGEAWSFRTLESQFRADPREFEFRRRLETLEKGLANRTLVLLDSRISRDGGELWLMP